MWEGCSNPPNRQLVVVVIIVVVHHRSSLPSWARDAALLRVRVGRALLAEADDDVHEAAVVLLRGGGAGWGGGGERRGQRGRSGAETLPLPRHFFRLREQEKTSLGSSSEEDAARAMRATRTLRRLMARPLGSFFLSCLATFGV